MTHPVSKNLFNKSQLFLAICAAALGAETYLISGTTVNYSTIAVIFFASLFIYNASRLNLSLFNQSAGSKFALHLEGNSLSIIICLTSLIILFGLLTACHWMQLLVFMGTSLLSLFYMMPFKKNGVRVQGLRNNLLLKNIVLSVTWACATVLFPISLYENYLSEHELIFIFLRRFFFIYALTVIYDLRDLEEDKKAGMPTIALKFGEPATKLWSLLSLALFVVFIFSDPALAAPHTKTLSAALFLSAIVAALVTVNTHHLRNKSYYSLVVDSPMVLQFLLVLLFSLL